MQLRRMQKTEVLMVPTPCSHATGPRAPASRVQPSTQTPPRPSRPLQQQASKNPNTDSSMLKEQKSCSSRGLPRKQAQKGLSKESSSLKDRNNAHTHLHAHMPRHAVLYTICYLYTHIHTHIHREGRILSFGVALFL